MPIGRYVIALAIFLFAVPSVHAQTTVAANNVSVCGTPNSTYTTGRNNAITQNTSGFLCVTTSAGSSENANLTQVGGVNITLGQKTMAASLPVVISSDQASVHVSCDAGCSSSTAPADESAFTFGVTSQTPIGGVFQTTATSNPLTSGQMGAFQVTAQRALFVNLRTAAGAEIGTAASPVADTLYIGGALVSATNGLFDNLLQGNAVLSATNGLFANILQGNAVLSTGNPIFAQLTTGAAVIGSLVANQSVNVAQVNGATTVAAAAGVQKVGITGNAGAAMDAAGQNAASPANSLLVAGQFNTSPTTITSGNMSPLQLDNAGRLIVNVGAGGGAGGTSSNFAAAFPSTGTAIGVKAGSNMVNLTADGSDNLNVNCAVGCAGGSFNNNADGVATSSTNGQAAAWLYGWNGATWDRLTDDASKNLKVNVAAAIAAGTNIIGKVGVDQTTPGTTNGAAVVGVNAATALAGAGATGTGSLRVTAAQDTTTIAGSAPGTAGSASTNVVTVQGIASMTALQVAVPTWAGGTLGAMANYGTSPGAVLVPGVNSFVTNTVTTTGSVSNAGSGVATGSVSVPTIAYNYGFNGTTWDQLQVNAAKVLQVGENASTGTTTTMQSAATGSGNGTVLVTTGMSSAMLTVNCSACSGGTAVNFEGTQDGTNYTAAIAANVGTTTFNATTTAAGITVWELPVTGFTNIRARISAYSAGTVTVTGAAYPVPYNGKAIFANANITQINNSTVAAGAGAVTSASIRVAVGQDVTTIAGSAPGTAGSASANVLTVQGVASMTPVANNMTQLLGSAVVAAATGVQKVGITGNAGAAMDAAGQNAASPANSLMVAGQFNTSPTTISSGNMSPLQLDSAGNLLVNLKTAASNLSSNLAQVNGSTTVTAATGVQKVGIVGNAGAAFDQVAGANAVPANALYEGINVAGNLRGWTGVNPSGSIYAGQVDLASVGGTTTVTGGTNGSFGVGGLAANGASVAGNPVLHGGRAQNAEITPVTNGQAATAAYDLVGKQIVMPFANKENFISGVATATTATNTQIIAAQAAGIKIYMTGFSCYNSGATTSTLLFTSASGGTTIWSTILPAGGGSNGQIMPPVPTAAAAALFMTTGSSSTTMSCAVTGYIGT